MNQLIKNVNESKNKLHPIILVLLFMPFYVIMNLIIGLVIGVVGGVLSLDMSLFDNNTFQQYFSFTTMVIISVIWVKLIERRPSLKLSPSKIIKGYLGGALGGFIAVAIPSIIMLIFANPSGKLNIDLSLATLNGVLVYLIFFLIQGAAEEIMTRWTLMLPLGKKIGIIPSIVVTSLLFSAMHLRNPGIGIIPLLNIFLAGAVFGMMFYYYESPWPAFAAHSLWNFTMGNIFGILVSGQDFGASIFKPTISGPELISGGQFGVEGTIFTTIIGIAIFTYYIIMYKKKFGSFSVKEKPENIVEETI